MNVLIHPDQSTTLIRPRNACTKSDDDTYLLVVVCSALANDEERQAIRESWARDQAANVKVVFLVGKLKNESSPVMTEVQHEAEEHGDVLQEDFIDSYANLTVKSVMMLKWFTQNCKDTPYLLKTDDDMYINLKNLYDMVTKNKNPYLMAGSSICGAKPIRDPSNKWHSPVYMFDGKVYPNYLSGTAYLLSGSVAQLLYKTALLVPAFHLEDIYLTGILRSKFNELSVAKTPKGETPLVLYTKDDLKFSLTRTKEDPCIYSNIISSHHFNPTKLKSMYERIQSLDKPCPAIKPKHLRSYPIDKCWLRSMNAAHKKLPKHG